MKPLYPGQKGPTISWNIPHPKSSQSYLPNFIKSSCKYRVILCVILCVSLQLQKRVCSKPLYFATRVARTLLCQDAHTLCPARRKTSAARPVVRADGEAHSWRSSCRAPTSSWDSLGSGGWEFVFLKTSGESTPVQFRKSWQWFLYTLFGPNLLPAWYIS